LHQRPGEFAHDGRHAGTLDRRLHLAGRTRRTFVSLNILSYNPGHDGAIAHLRDGHLVSSIEAERTPIWRYTRIGSRDVLDAFARLEQVPERSVHWRGGGRARDARLGRRRTLGIAASLKTESPWTSPLDREVSPVLLLLSQRWSHLLCGFGCRLFPRARRATRLCGKGARRVL